MDDFSSKEEERCGESSSTPRSLRVKTDSSKTSVSSASPIVSFTELRDGKTVSKKLAKSIPDMVLDWSELEVTFRIINKKGVDPEVSYPLFPPPPDLKIIPWHGNSNGKKKVIKRVTANTKLSSSESIPSNPSTEQSQAKKTVSGSWKNGSGKNSSGKNSSGKLQCHLCDRTFSKSSYLKSHLQSHPNSKPFKCEICGWGFFQQDNLIRHMASHTQGGEGFKCSHCVASFNSKSVLAIHMKDAHGEKSVAISTGPATPGSCKPPGPLLVTGSVKNSILKLGPPPPLVSIRSVSPLKLALTSPAVLTPSSQLSTPPALKQGSIARLPTAAQVLSGMKGSPIGPCGIKVAVGHSPLIAGRKIVQVGSSPVQSSSPGCKCQVCGKLFLTSSNLKQHMNMHKIQNKPFKCSFCDARFAQESNLDKHLASAHASAGHQCPHCSIKFRTLPDVEGHIRIMHPLALATSNGFLGHTDTMLGLNDILLDEEMEEEEEIPSKSQFACSVCFMSFDRVDQLNVHVRKHALQKSNLDIKPISLLKPQLEIKRENHLHPHQSN